MCYNLLVEGSYGNVTAMNPYPVGSRMGIFLCIFYPIVEIEFCVVRSSSYSSAGLLGVG